MPNRALAVGVGMAKFEKPGGREGWGYPQMSLVPGTTTLNYVGMDFSAVQRVYVANVTAAMQHNIGPGGAAAVTDYQKVER